MFCFVLFFLHCRLEAAKDDYRIRCEELEKEIGELRGQNEELTSLADEAQSLKDEMDVLRYSINSFYCISQFCDYTVTIPEKKVSCTICSK